MSLFTRYCGKCGQPIKDGTSGHMLGCPPHEQSIEETLLPELGKEVARLRAELAVSATKVRLLREAIQAVRSADAVIARCYDPSHESVIQDDCGDCQKEAAYWAAYRRSREQCQTALDATEGDQ